MESSRVHNEIKTSQTKNDTNSSNNNVNKKTLFRAENRDYGPTEKRTKLKSGGVVGHVAQVLLRSVAALLIVGSVVIMLFFAEQTYTIGDFSIHASYKSSSAFKFFVYASGVVGLYCILSISFVFCCSFVHILDMLVMVLAMASASAATAVGYIGKFGNEEIGWMKVCDYVVTFCNLATIAIGLSYSAFIALFLVCCVSFNMRSKPNIYT